MIGSNLKKLRNEKNLTQEDLASYLGIKRETYCQYENDRREPKASTIIALADFFEVSIDFLAGRTSEPVPLSFAMREEILLMEEYRMSSPKSAASEPIKEKQTDPVRKNPSANPDPAK